MKTRSTSLDSALTWASLSLLSFIGYTLMEMRYFLEKWIPGDNAAMIEVIVILLLIGGWLWALFAAAAGRRGGQKALLAFGGFAVLIALYDMQYVFSPQAALPWPETTMIFAMLGLAIAAIVALSLSSRKAGKTTS